MAKSTLSEVEPLAGNGCSHIRFALMVRHEYVDRLAEDLATDVIDRHPRSDN